MILFFFFNFITFLNFLRIELDLSMPSNQPFIRVFSERIDPQCGSEPCSDECSEACEKCITHVNGTPECQKCLNGFFLSQTKKYCIKCPSECAECFLNSAWLDETSFCTGTNKEKYYYSYNLDEKSDPVPCPDHCEGCFYGAVDATYEGYSSSTDTGTLFKNQLRCKACRVGFALSFFSLCDVCPYGCLGCVYGDKNNIETTITYGNNYFAKNSGNDNLVNCTLICSSCLEMKYLDKSTSECLSCPQNCLTCDLDNNNRFLRCSKCAFSLAGFHYNGSCQLCPRNCLFCFYGNKNGSNYTATSEFEALDNELASLKKLEFLCGECASGYYLGLDLFTCHPCPTDCQKCNIMLSTGELIESVFAYIQLMNQGSSELILEGMSAKCQNCEKGFSLDFFGACDEVCNLDHCSDCISPTKGNPICRSCVEGYVLDTNNECLDCNSLKEGCVSCDFSLSDQMNCTKCSNKTVLVNDLGLNVCLKCPFCSEAAFGYDYALHKEICYECSTRSFSEASNVFKDILKTFSKVWNYSRNDISHFALDGKCIECPPFCIKCEANSNSNSQGEFIDSDCFLCQPGSSYDSIIKTCVFCPIEWGACKMVGLMEFFIDCSEASSESEGLQKGRNEKTPFKSLVEFIDYLKSSFTGDLSFLINKFSLRVIEMKIYLKAGTICEMGYTNSIFNIELDAKTLSKTDFHLNIDVYGISSAESATVLTSPDYYYFEFNIFSKFQIRNLQIKAMKQGQIWLFFFLKNINSFELSNFQAEYIFPFVYCSNANSFVIENAKFSKIFQAYYRPSGEFRFFYFYSIKNLTIANFQFTEIYGPRSKIFEVNFVNYFILENVIFSKCEFASFLKLQSGKMECYHMRITNLQIESNKISLLEPFCFISLGSLITISQMKFLLNYIEANNFGADNIFYYNYMFLIERSFREQFIFLNDVEFLGNIIESVTIITFYLINKPSHITINNFIVSANGFKGKEYVHNLRDYTDSLFTFRTYYYSSSTVLITGFYFLSNTVTWKTAILGNIYQVDQFSIKEAHFHLNNIDLYSGFIGTKVQSLAIYKSVIEGNVYKKLFFKFFEVSEFVAFEFSQNVIINITLYDDPLINLKKLRISPQITNIIFNNCLVTNTSLLIKSQDKTSFLIFQVEYEAVIIFSKILIAISIDSRDFPSVDGLFSSLACLFTLRANVFIVKSLFINTPKTFYVESNSVTVEDSVFSDNDELFVYQQFKGGALKGVSLKKVDIKNCIFDGNIAFLGSALYLKLEDNDELKATSITIFRTSFLNNKPLLNNVLFVEVRPSNNSQIYISLINSTFAKNSFINNRDYVQNLVTFTSDRNFLLELVIESLNVLQNSVANLGSSFFLAEKLSSVFLKINGLNFKGQNFRLFSIKVDSGSIGINQLFTQELILKIPNFLKLVCRNNCSLSINGSIFREIALNIDSDFLFFENLGSLSLFNIIFFQISRISQLSSKGHFIGASQINDILIQHCIFDSIWCGGCESVVGISQISVHFLLSLSQIYNCSSNFYGFLTLSQIEAAEGRSLIISTEFESNFALYHGGALAVSTDSRVTLNDIIFRRNSCQRGFGGAIYYSLDLSEHDPDVDKIIYLTIVNCKFYENFIKGSLSTPGQSISQVDRPIENIGDITFWPKIKENVRGVPFKLALAIESNETNKTSLIFDSYRIENYSSGLAIELKLNFLILDTEENFLANLTEKWFLSAKIFGIEPINTTSPPLLKSSNDTPLQISPDFITGIYSYPQIIILGDRYSTVTVRFSFENSIKLFPKPYGADAKLYFDLVFKIKDCEIGQWHDPYSNVCLDCPPQTFSFGRQEPCKACPEHAQCLGGSKVLLNPGYWRISNESSIIIECLNAKANCPGGEGFKCLRGLKGPRCEVCDLSGEVWGEKFTEVKKFSCSPCSRASYNFIKLILITALIFAFLEITLRSTENSAERQILIVTLETISNWNSTHLRSKSAAYIKVLTDYFQIYLAFGSLKLEIPREVSSIPETVGTPVSSILYSVDCFLSGSALASFFPYTYSRLIFMVLTSGMFLMVFYFIKFVANLIFSKRADMSYSLHVISAIFIFLYVQSDIVNYSVSLLFCVQINTGGEFNKFIKGNLNLQCETEQHQIYKNRLVLPIFLFYAFILPGFLLLLMLSRRKSLYIYKNRMYFGILYNEYKREAFYWEFIKMYKRIFLVLIISFLETDTNQRGIGVIALISIYSGACIYREPFLTRDLNDLEVESCGILMMSIIFGLLIHNNSLYFALNYVFLAIVWIINACLIFKIVFRIIEDELFKFKGIFIKLGGKFLILVKIIETLILIFGIQSIKSAKKKPIRGLSALKRIIYNMRIRKNASKSGKKILLTLDKKPRITDQTSNKLLKKSAKRVSKSVDKPKFKKIDNY